MLKALWGRVPALVVDVAMAVFFVVVSQVELHLRVDDGYQAGPLWLNVPLVLLMAAPVGLRRVTPTAAWAVSLAAACLPGPVVAHTIFFWGSMVPMAILTYTLARHRDTWPARQAWLAGPLLLVANMPHVAELRTASNVFFGLGTYGVAWLVGRVLHRLSLRDRQLSAALASLAEEQALREEAAVEAERSRIAGEMHDVVAHAVSLMVVQLGAARMKLDRDGAAAPAELRAAEDTGRQALAELRRTLGLLRHGDAALEPLPGMDAVGELVTRCRAAGVDVRLELGDVGDLPPSVQLAAYRVLQEALTNVVKHAGAVVAEASVTRHGEVVEVVVRSAPGARTASTAGGHGITGMRERVAMFGGTLAVGPDASGGFRVLARLPVPASAEVPG
jgi:signal transduction histidine kinase